MTMDQLFSSCSSFAVVGWLLLLFLPRWRWTERLVVSGGWSLALSVVYLFLIVRFMPGAAGGFGSIAEVRMFFGQDALLVAGWVHYLAFDLLVGAFEVKQAKEHGIPHLLVIPALILTFLLGPIGLLFFFVVKFVRLKKLAGVLP
jgi:hypothetical protein